MKRTIFWVLGALTFTLCSAPARAWWPQSHSLITEGALRALPPDVPLFLRRDNAVTIDCAQDPDAFKNAALPEMTDAEAPNHFIDWELLQGQPLPPTRGEFLQLCAKLRLDPQRVGLAPYAVAEWTQRLTIAFAEYRKSPNDRAIQSKIAVYAGILSHYSADLCMPLHTTIHFDGRVKPDEASLYGTSPRSGIHAKIDSLPERLNLSPLALAKQQTIQPIKNLVPEIVREIGVSRAQIYAAYRLEKQLPPEETRSWKPSNAVRVWGTARAREATRFTSALFLTAWRDSATLQLPSWWKPSRERPTAKSSTRLDTKKWG